MAVKRIVESKYDDLNIQEGSVIESRWSHKQYVIKEITDDYAVVKDYNTGKESYINLEHLNEYNYDNVDLVADKDADDLLGNVNASSITGITTDYTGGGIWLTFARVKGTPYYFVIEDEDWNEGLSLFDSRGDDYEFATQDMVWSKELDDLTPGEKEVYKVMRDDYNKTVN